MLKLHDLIIDPRSLGDKLWLVDVSPTYRYENGQRTNTIDGHRYVIALPEKGLEKIGVKIEGPQLLDTPDDGFEEVQFDDLEIFVYFRDGQPQVGARAKGIHLVHTKS